MPYDDFDDSNDDKDLPLESDMDDGDSSDIDTEPCPICGKPVYENANLCPHCKNFITPGYEAGGKPTWAIVLIIICLLVVLGWSLR